MTTTTAIFPLDLDLVLASGLCLNFTLGATCVCTPQPPVQITSLSGTYATSTYLAAAKKSQKELESVASGLQSIEKKLKDDQKTADALSESRLRRARSSGPGRCSEGDERSVTRNVLLATSPFLQ